MAGTVHHGQSAATDLPAYIQHPPYRGSCLCCAYCRRAHRRIAVSFALFNVLVLVSRLSNSFLGPFLAKRIESARASGTGEALLGEFRVILLSATAAAVVGALMVPTVQRWFCRAIAHFQGHRSMGRLLLHAFSKGGIGYIRRTSTVPAREKCLGIAQGRRPADESDWSKTS